MARLLRRRMSRSMPRLSEVARELVYPSDIVTSGFPRVREQCARMGISFDQWQDGAGTLILGKNGAGKYAASIGGVFLSISRQVGKTFLVGAIVVALCVLFPGYTVLWTAHRTRTTTKTFANLKSLVRKKKVWPHVESVRSANGEQEIRFTNGSVIMFGAREQGFGRGFDAVDAEVFDEAQILTEKALDDMVPATNQARHEAGALLIYMGTPPRPTDPGEVFATRRAEALSGGAEHMVWIEFSADPGTDPAKWPPGQVDWTQVAKANPSYPHRTGREAILRTIKNLGSPASVARESLGLWDDGAGPKAVFKDLWSDLGIDVAPSGQVVYGVKYSPDGGVVALAVGVKPTDGPVHGEIVRVETTDEGDAWLVDWLVERWRASAGIVIDGRAGAGPLMAELARRGVSTKAILAPTTEQVVTAHSWLLTAAKQGQVSHVNQPGLTASALSAAKRRIGTAGGFGWEPLGDGDVTPLEAFTFATWWANTTTRNNFLPDAPRRLY